MNAKRAAEGIGLIAIGAILLANTIGYLEWGVWWNIFSLWPLLIVSLGIEVIGASTKQTWIRVLSNVVILGGLAYAVFIMPVGDAGPWNVVTIWPGEGEMRSYEYREPHDEEVEVGTADVKGGVGRLTVTAGDDLASADIRSPFGEPLFEVETRGIRTEVAVQLSEADRSGVDAVSGGDMRLAFDEHVVWDLTIDGSVAELDADLRDLELSALDVNAGVSTGVIVLGVPAGDGRTVASVDVAVSSLTLLVPRGTAVRITESGGLSALHLDDGFERVSSGGAKVYETDGFDANDAYWDITLQSGVSVVRLEWYEE